MTVRGNDGEQDPLEGVGSRPQTPLDGLDELGAEIERASRSRSTGGRHARSRVRHRWRRWVLAGLAALLVLVVAGAGYVYYLTHDLHRVTVRGLHSAFKSGQELGTENILMVGSTSRCALTVQNPAYGLCSQGVSGVNSDVMMILHADPTHHRLALLSIPRDLFIPNARKRRTQQDRRRPLSGPDPGRRGGRGGLRHPDPARGLAQLRPVRQYRRRARWDQHVVPDVGVRLGTDRGGADGDSQ